MIIFVYGTTGELIKLAPVMVRLRDRNLEYMAVSTQQQPQQIEAMHEEFGLRAPDYFLSNGSHGRDLSRNVDLPVWGWSVLRGYLHSRSAIQRRLHGAPGKHLLMVHGDTFTTVIGALIGRSLRIPVAHLEAGMRSGDWRHPFPEELNRRAVARIATIHYAPSLRAT